MINNISPQTSFTGKIKQKRIIPKAKSAFHKLLPDIQSPQKLLMLQQQGEKIETSQIKEADQKLRFVRAFIPTLYRDGGLAEHFRGMIGIVKAFKVGNCAEQAEIMKTILRLNGIRNADIFELYAKDKNGVIRTLDQTIVATNVPKSKNLKRNNIFKPKANTMIIDMWHGGFVGKVKNSFSKYKIFGLTTNDTLMFRSVKTYEPDRECFKNILKEFPYLKIDK